MRMGCSGFLLVFGWISQIFAKDAAAKVAIKSGQQATKAEEKQQKTNKQTSQNRSKIEDKSQTILQKAAKEARDRFWRHFDVFFWKFGPCPRLGWVQQINKHPPQINKTGITNHFFFWVASRMRFLQILGSKMVPNIESMTDENRVLRGA